MDSQNRPRPSEPDDGSPSHILSDMEAEQQVIGALLLDDYAIRQIAGVLEADDFFRPIHRKVYNAMLALHEQGQPTDISLVRAELEQRDDLEKVGGTAKLVEWVTYVPTAANVLHYAGLVADRAKRRRLLQAVGAIGNLVYDAPTAEEASRQALEILAKAAASKTGSVKSLGALATEVWDKVQAATDARQNGEIITTGRPTGLMDLDAYGGLGPGQLILLAARPSMGKTSLAVQIAASVAHDGGRVLIFSLETPGDEIAGRVLWQRTRLDGTQALQGMLDEGNLAALASEVGQTEGLRVWVDDTAGLSVAALIARAQAHAGREGLDMVIVDYLQLLRGTSRKDPNRAAEVTEISQALKGLARTLNVPVLALSQLNRQVEHRSDARPLLSDLRDSGSLEQDADQVWLLWRDDPNVPQAGLAVAKNRNGPTGAFLLRWDAPTTRFDALDRWHNP